MEFKDLMEQFGRKVGIADLEPAADGICRVDIDGMTVGFVEVPETRQIVTRANVGELPSEGRERLYRVLMESMYMGRATGGSTFCIDPETENVNLFRFDSLPLIDLESFSAMLEKFVNILEEWRKILAEYGDVALKLENVAHTEREESRQMGTSGFLQV